MKLLIIYVFYFVIVEFIDQYQCKESKFNLFENNCIETNQNQRFKQVTFDEESKFVLPVIIPHTNIPNVILQNQVVYRHDDQFINSGLLFKPINIIKNSVFQPNLSNETKCSKAVGTNIPSSPPAVPSNNSITPINNNIEKPKETPIRIKPINNTNVQGTIKISKAPIIPPKKIINTDNTALPRKIYNPTYKLANIIEDLLSIDKFIIVKAYLTNEELILVSEEDNILNKLNLNSIVAIQADELDNSCFIIFFISQIKLCTINNSKYSKDEWLSSIYKIKFGNSQSSLDNLNNSIPNDYTGVILQPTNTANENISKTKVNLKEDNNQNKNYIKSYIKTLLRKELLKRKQETRKSYLEPNLVQENIKAETIILEQIEKETIRIKQIKQELLNLELSTQNESKNINNNVNESIQTNPKIASSSNCHTNDVKYIIEYLKNKIKYEELKYQNLSSSSFCLICCKNEFYNDLVDFNQCNNSC